MNCLKTEKKYHKVENDINTYLFIIQTTDFCIER